MLRRIATPPQLKKMTFEEGMMALTMYKMGGSDWNDWKRAHPTQWYNPNADPMARTNAHRLVGSKSFQRMPPAY